MMGIIGTAALMLREADGSVASAASREEFRYTACIAGVIMRISLSSSALEIAPRERKVSNISDTRCPVYRTQLFYNGIIGLQVGILNSGGSESV